MVNYSSAAALDATFSALSDPTRRAMLARLARHDAAVGPRARPFEMSLPAVSKHLRVLHHAGLVAREKHGRVHRLSLVPGPLEEAQAWIDRVRNVVARRLEAFARPAPRGARRAGKARPRASLEPRAGAARRGAGMDRSLPPLLAAAAGCSRRLSERFTGKGEIPMAEEKQNPDARLQVRRTFAAPREKIFAAWTDPEKMTGWLCRVTPKHTMKILELDVRPGGRYRFEVTTPEGERHLLSGQYREVQSPERLVFTWSMDADPDVGETLVTVELFARGRSTELVLTHERFATRMWRDRHAAGWIGCFDVLTAELKLKGESDVRS